MQRWLLALLMLLAVSRPATAEPWAVSGWGALPLSDQAVSLWLSGPESPTRPPPLAIVYFLGSVGWHAVSWTHTVDIMTPLGWAELRAIGIRLYLEVEPERDRVVVQYDEFALSEANVFVVFDTGSATEKVVPFGRLPLRPTETPASLTLLHENQHLVELIAAYHDH